MVPSTEHSTVGIGFMRSEEGPNAGKDVPAIMLEFDNQIHPFRVDEARALAEIMERGIHKFPDDSAVDFLADVILTIRFACDEAGKEYGDRDNDKAGD